ncbi:MAG TPA: ABC transporter permease [Conexibacter sp.]|nr:ABC transporter permease [Conexibacter sp.]
MPARGRRRLLYRDVSRRLYWGVAIGSFVLLIAGWWLYAEFGGQSDLFLPSPVQVANRLIDLAQDGSLWDDVKISFARVSIGFLLSSAMALPIGILIGSYRLAEAAIEPTMGFIRYMPAVAFVPLTIIWVGVGEEQKWLVIWIGTFFSQVLLVMDNVKRVRQELVGIGYTLGMNEASILGRIVIPASAPAIWDTLRVTLGWAWTWLVLAELVAAESGLGHRVVLAQRFFQTDTIFVALIVIGAIGLAMDQLMKFAGRRLFHWAERG